MNNQIEALILDWAGTVVDFGSFAPTAIFVEAFAEAFDFPISLAEARVPMGLGKWDHIHTLGQLPEVAARWQARFGRPMGRSDVDFIYATFMPLQIEAVARYSAPIAGVLPVLDRLRERGIKLGSCSGYPRAVMEALVPAAAAHGYRPDHWVASDDLPAGARPGPWMALENVVRLGVGDVAHCIKVDDAIPGIEEGKRAGMWTVGLAVSGNEFGATWEAFQAMTPEEIAQRRERASERLKAAGAHYVIDTLADIEPVIAEIAARLARGERP
ncbi:phosphonoacetaldehyde hydrolase [Aeromonas simiae]|uniref:phosphonoacetaldehyde hydrolase n=1 Tax=Aeromonas simiae TaxID=218936 RepID=UPI0005A9215E|nr:phosphonoacetaldehyde hydrolase [Aeromonas simiae]MDO2946811.1 phosphonoacetaldehyde hydrolase [Aeromonas simiae]MDO2951388.1 phosphonoacetaldehyde hydrolase [Aeromonas simiae]MDO2954595.1 phosphonoacetaldehyde hydrolase [Aeromonas simiae]